MRLVTCLIWLHERVRLVSKLVGLQKVDYRSIVKLKNVND